jgi:L-alanine-DL-glutamate epimerase-like enolase superfamily enzyme
LPDKDQSRAKPVPDVRITSIESRILGYDVAEAWLPEGPPEGLSSTWYEYSLDAFKTDEGIVGYTMQNSNLGDGAEMGNVLHRVYAPQLIGENPLAIEGLWHKIRRLNRHAYNLSDGVAGCIDVALWDIAGKVANLPIAKLLGLAREKIPAYATARSIRPKPETVYNEAKQRKAEGYHAFKIQFWDGLDLDIPRFRAARAAVGDSYPLMQDAAGMYSYTDALAAGLELDRLGYTWFEEPIPDRNTLLLKRLTESLDVPILAGETLRVHELAEQMRDGVFDIARGDVHLKEGITGLRKAVGMADLLGYDLEIHGVAQPLLEAANLHVSLAMTNGRWAETFHPVYGKGLMGNPLAVDADGYKHLPPKPGLGVDLDWNWIDKVTQRVIRTPAN